MKLRLSLAVVITLSITTAAAAQFDLFQGGFGRGGRNVRPKFPTADTFGHGFNFCRGMYAHQIYREAGGQGWSTDYPDAELNFSIRLSELTKTRVAFDRTRTPDFVTVRLTDDALFQCPQLHMEDVGTLEFDEEEINTLRAWFAKGGFLWVDDFWGSSAWEQWEAQIGRVLPPAEYPIVNLPLDHPLFTAQFTVTEFPQIPSIQAWRGNDVDTSERGADSEIPRAQGDPRPPWQRDGVHVAQHRHLGCVGTRGGGSAVLLPVLAQGVCRRHQRDAVCDDALSAS